MHYSRIIIAFFAFLFTSLAIIGRDHEAHARSLTQDDYGDDYSGDGGMFGDLFEDADYDAVDDAADLGGSEDFDLFDMSGDYGDEENILTESVAEDIDADADYDDPFGIFSDTTEDADSLLLEEAEADAAESVLGGVDVDDGQGGFGCGNYCGPGWCGGVSSDECTCGFGVEPAGCIDACCKAHDQCCGTAAGPYTGCNGEIMACIAACDGDDDGLTGCSQSFVGGLMELMGADACCGDATCLDSCG